MESLQNPKAKHPALITSHREGFAPGFTSIATEQDSECDFGIHILEDGEIFEEAHRKEVTWVLLFGKAELEWPGGRAIVNRKSIFDEPPSALSVPADAKIRVRALSPRVEWAVLRATNDRQFDPRFYGPDEIVPEYRGRGLVQGACLRNVRLIFDHSIRPVSNLVVGEVVNFPGKWSSYPPHHHAQPELYHYRFTMPQGYGHAELGEDVLKVRNFDTLRIPGGLDHAQASAPGYGMYYLWVVRHLEKNPYLGFEFTEDHRWILNPENQGWEPKL